MRFLASGPDIPDELLTARDEGRVVLFCGAGVSRAKVGLPGFLSLARDVLNGLEGTGASDSKRLIEAAEEVENKAKVSGLFSPDRIFGILERDFEIADVEEAVAKALKPKATPDLTAHKWILDLARGPDKRTRLITTNFDRLFEDADPTLATYLPRNFPDPEALETLDGIVHLHGRVAGDYSRAEGDGFVLSTAEFGRAYISRGWAARFISAILRRYLVVFVGYTADDPPVQYLLEALNREPGSSNGLYAFQSASHSDAAARWLSKGVQPIPYDDRAQHQALWNSIAEWAARARDVDAWYGNTVELARRGPAALAPYQRGQIKHVVSTLDGARRFARADNPPPAEWLCVFDRTMRFAPPRNVYMGEESGKTVDPFKDFGLDCDPVPPSPQPGEMIHKRDVPERAWDCFELTRLDREGLPPRYFACLSGDAALAPRLWELAIWIGSVAGQPAAVWWAAGRSAMHPNLQAYIGQRLRVDKEQSTDAVRRAWSYVLEAWETHPFELRRDRYDLEKSIELDGWSPAAVRQWAAVNGPRFKAQRSMTHGHRPPAASESHSFHNLVSMDVDYPTLGTRLRVPDEFVRHAVREWRKLLEQAVLMEREVSYFGLDRFDPLIADPEDEGPRLVSGINVPILYYVQLLRRLIGIDSAAAVEECASWWSDDDDLFARLRIWRCGERGFLEGCDAAHMFLGLSRTAFWRLGHQHDLLLTLAKRWADIPAGERARLVERVLDGPARFEKEEESHYAERRAVSSLNVMYWLNDQGCDLGIDIDAEAARLSALAPQWRRSYSADAAESFAPRVRSVTRDSAFDELLSVPMDDLLNRAKQISGRDGRRPVEKDPFSGLARERPVRALSAITRATRAGTHETWAWRTLLNELVRPGEADGNAGDDRKVGGKRFEKLLAARLSRLPQPVLAELANPIAEWVLEVCRRDVFRIQDLDGVWTPLLAALRTLSGKDREEGAKEPDWASVALNAPVGKLAQAVMASSGDGEIDGLDRGWLDRAEALLGLDGDLRRHALAIFSYNLPWFFQKNPIWTSDHLLSALERPEDESAMWAGLLWAARVPQPPLFLRLKPAMLRLEPLNWIERDRHIEILAAFLLSGWGRPEETIGARLVSNEEMRALLLSAGEEFRAQVLWLLSQWVGEPDGPWRTLIREFLLSTWPRQKVVKSPQVSARLCELALSGPEVFAAIHDVVLKLVTTVDRDRLHLYNFIENPQAIVEKHAKEVVQLLSIVLPHEVSHWPYGIEKVFDIIAAADPVLQTDARLLELRRRWNAR